MSGYTDSEKIQYALKTALYRTMQTSMSDSASVERSAPLRVFPTNIMKVNIIEAGKGDIGEDGTYVTGHTTAGQTADLSDPESTVKNYKIICPVNNVITSITISALVGYGSQTKTQVDALPTSGQTYPLKQWFFRGHYTGSGEAAFNAANVTYDGLQLAWNNTTNNTTPSEADIVPHLKYYLQVQTNYTGVSHSSSADNITYEHGLLKGLIGLDSNFVSTIMVTQGEGGPSSSASLGTSGSQAGEFWFTQATAGILSFYGVTSKVDASTDLATFNTKYPMISYVRYTGETGFGAGTGGGGGAAADPEQAVTSEPSWSSGSVITSFMDGNVGIGTTSPESNAKLTIRPDVNTRAIIIKSPATSTTGVNHTIDWQRNDGIIVARIGTESYTHGRFIFRNNWTSSSAPNNGGFRFQVADPNIDAMQISANGNVGIGTTSPQRKLHIKGGTGINGDIRLGMDYGPGGGWGAYTDLNSIEFYAPDNGTPNTGKVAYRLTHQVYEANGNSLLVMKATEANGNTESNLMTWKHGNVGIGTRTPISKLSVYHGGITLDNTYTTYSAASVAATANSLKPFEIRATAGSLAGDWGILRLRAGGGTYMTTCSFIDIVGYNGTDSTTIKFFTSNAERMRIASNGNVGIGTTSPGYKLEVDGKAKITGDTYLGSYTAWAGDINNTKRAWGSGYIYWTTDNAAWELTLKDGKLGIGTTSPGYNLEVVGNMKCSSYSRVGSYYRVESGIIDVTGKSSSSYHKYNFPAGSGSVGNGVVVRIFRNVHDNGSWYGSNGFECHCYPAGYGHLPASYWYIIRNISRSGNGIGKVYSHGLWSYLGIWLKGGRTYKYTIIHGNGFSDGGESISSAETIADGSAGWSDDRIKHNEIHIDNGLSIINQLKPQKYIKTENQIYHERYNFELDASGNPLDPSGNPLDANEYKIETGLIAQDVEKIEELKYLVSNANAVDHNGVQLKAVYYQDIFVYNIAATQELHKKQQADEAKIAELEAKVSTLESELATIKQHLGL